MRDSETYARAEAGAIHSEARLGMDSLRPHGHGKAKQTTRLSWREGYSAEALKCLLRRGMGTCS